MKSSTDRGPAHQVDLPSGPLRYHDTGGEGRAIVFVHGLLADGDLWRKVVPGLAPDHRCITPDLPLGAHRVPMPAGTDLAPPGLARLVVEFLTALDLRDVVLVGNDSGGSVCQIVVTEHPERVTGLVLTPSDAFDNLPPPRIRPFVVLARRAPGLLRPLLRMLATRPGLWALRKVGDVRPMPDALLRRWVRAGLEDAGVLRDLTAVLAGADPRHTRRAAERLPGFAHPALIVWADEQRLFPLAHAARLAGLLPDARVKVVADSGIFLPEDQPEALVGVVREYLGVC